MIKEASHIKEYQLRVVFEDGVVKTIDLKEFLSNSKHPLIRKYLSVEMFKKFSIDYGTICWGENDFDLNPQKIREGVYDAKPLPLQ